MKNNYFFFPKYIKAKNETVLTIAIKYQPDVELLEISDIYFVDFSDELIISGDISNESKFLIFIYKNRLTTKKITPNTIVIIAPSTNKSFHV